MVKGIVKCSSNCSNPDNDIFSLGAGRWNISEQLSSGGVVTAYIGEWLTEYAGSHKYYIVLNSLTSVPDSAYIMVNGAGVNATVWPRTHVQDGNPPDVQDGNTVNRFTIYKYSGDSVRPLEDSNGAVPNWNDFGNSVRIVRIATTGVSIP